MQKKVLTMRPSCDNIKAGSGINATVKGGKCR
nr:MAG TPA: hypothetical protein [Caudoviricetes sp.]